MTELKAPRLTGSENPPNTPEFFQNRQEPLTTNSKRARLASPIGKLAVDRTVVLPQREAPKLGATAVRGAELADRGFPDRGSTEGPGRSVPDSRSDGSRTREGTIYERRAEPPERER